MKERNYQISFLSNIKNFTKNPLFVKIKISFIKLITNSLPSFPILSHFFSDFYDDLSSILLIKLHQRV